MTRWTEEQLAAYAATGHRVADTSDPPFHLPANDAGAYASAGCPRAPCT